MKADYRVETISNKYMKFSFDRATGRLVSMRNLLTSNEYLQGRATQGNPFAVYYDFIRDYEISIKDNRVLDSGSDPQSISRKDFSPYTYTKVAFERLETKETKTLKIVYTAPSGPWQVKITVSLNNRTVSSSWDMTLTNTGRSSEQFLGVFPMIGGLKLGDGRRNLMVVNNQAGYIRPLWSEKGGIYGNSTQMSMQWGCIFDETTGDAFGFIVKDRSLKNKEIKYKKPSIQVRYFPVQTLGPGQSISFPKVEVMVYTGDWKRTGAAYHDWFANAFKSVRHPDWVRQMDSHLGQWFEKCGQKTSKNHRSIKGLANRMDSFLDLPNVYRRLPVETIEFAFFCRASMGENISGKKFTHTDGDNIIREDLGGPVALKKGVKMVHNLGFHMTLYIDGHICPGDSNVALKGNAREWAITNKDGSNTGNYSGTTNWMHMCPGAGGWQNHLAMTTARLCRETGVDGIRLDSIGPFFMPCYNPTHNHKSPYDWNQWMCELLDTVATAVRKINPDCFLSTELPVDFYNQYFNGSLTQQWGLTRFAVTRDVVPMRIAVPEYFVIAHNPCGPVAASLMGYPGGNGGWVPGGYFTELDEKWRSVMFTVGNIIRWGNAAHDNSKVSRRDVFCRRFSAAGIDVIVGARPRFATDFSKYDGIDLTAVRNADVDIKKNRVSFRIRIDTDGNTPARVYLYDIMKVSVEEVSFETYRNGVVINLVSNWFMLILTYDKGKPLALFDIPKVLYPGETYDVRLSLLGVTSRELFHGSLHAPGLGWAKANNAGLKVTVPSVLRLTVPETTPKGKYQIKLYSKQFLGCKRFVKVG